MSYPKPLPERVNAPVRFSAPKGAVVGAPRRGRVAEALAFGPYEDKGWGYYVYFAERIAWPDEQQPWSVRLAYFYAPYSAKRWLWGGQYSIEETPRNMRQILEGHLNRNIGSSSRGPTSASSGRSALRAARR